MGEMPVIRVETVMKASQEACFDSHRDLALHAKSAKRTGERIIGERQVGLLELGDEVTFEARHFGLKFGLTSKIVEFDRPNRFVDEMQRGPFQNLRHVHEFQEAKGGTQVVDVMDFCSPFGLLGMLADRLFIAGHLKEFLRQRNSFLRQILEREDAQ